MTNRKIGFWSVLALVIGSQVGAGAFLMPAVLAPYGYFGSVGLLVAVGAAICLAIMFATLCNSFPKTGGPHVYINQAFGGHAAFFVGWSYWLVSWVSTTIVIIMSVQYLSPFIGDRSPTVYLILEIILLGLITILNLRGTQAAGKAEFLLTVLKFVPMLVLPIIALFYFKSSNFVLAPTIASLGTTKILGQAVLLTLFSFLGVETGTTTAGAVQNPTKTIPRALIVGTACVALLYFFNVIGINGLIPAELLAQSKAPYIDVVAYIFHGNWHFMVAIIISLVCIGTANAWTLTSGQTILGLAEDKLMPKIFAQRNAQQAPVWGILVSSIGMAIILIATAEKDLIKQLELFINCSVAVFMFVYLICGLAAVKIYLFGPEKINLLQWLAIIIAILFCTWVIVYATPARDLFISSLFVLSGLPIYLFWYLKSRRTL